MSNTYLAHAIETTDGAGTYDESAKYLLADKQILAYILKHSVAEFRDMPVEQVLDCIGDDVEVGTGLVDPGLSKLSSIRGSNREDSVPGEGKNFYDVRFCAYLKEDKTKILVDMEAQKSTDPGKLGYHLGNRIVFYLSRMISAQKLTEFYHSDYDNLKKVRSIWICMDGDDEAFIEEISLDNKRILGDKPMLVGADLMKAVIVHIRGQVGKSDSKNPLIFMLEILFSELSVQEKKHILSEECGFIMTVELEGRIQDMCNISEVIIERCMERGMKQGMERGIEQGIEQGMERGIEQERINAIGRMMKAGATNVQMLSYGYTENELAKAKSKLCSYA